ncbi:hypothetical protein THAOC_31756, partial [Thalassiosira oceanica]
MGIPDTDAPKSNSCPTCRCHITAEDNGNSKSQTPIIKNLIDNLHVKCINQHKRDETLRELETKENDPSNSKLQRKILDLDSCGWTGKLCEYKLHAESCLLEKVECKHCGNEQLQGYTRSGYCNQSECNVASARQYLARRKMELAASKENCYMKQRDGMGTNHSGTADLDERVKRACFKVKMLNADTASVSKPVPSHIVRKRDRLLSPRPRSLPERSPAVQQPIQGSTEVASNEDESNNSSSDDRDYSVFIMASVRLLVDKEMAKIRNEFEAQT